MHLPAEDPPRNLSVARALGEVVCDQPLLLLGYLDVRAGDEQQLDDEVAPLGARAVQRRVAVLVLQVGVGAAVEQQPHRRVVAVQRRADQRRVAAVALPVDVGAVLQQQLDDLVVLRLEAREDQRRVALGVARVDVGVVEQQHRHHRRVAPAAREHQQRARSVPVLRRARVDVAALAQPLCRRLQPRERMLALVRLGEQHPGREDQVVRRLAGRHGVRRMAKREAQLAVRRAGQIGRSVRTAAQSPPTRAAA